MTIIILNAPQKVHNLNVTLNPIQISKTYKVISKTIKNLNIIPQNQTFESLNN